MNAADASDGTVKLNVSTQEISNEEPVPIQVLPVVTGPRPQKYMRLTSTILLQDISSIPLQSITGSFVNGPRPG